MADMLGVGDTLHHNTFGGGATFTVLRVWRSKKRRGLQITARIELDDGAAIVRPVRCYSWLTWCDLAETASLPKPRKSP